MIETVSTASAISMIISSLLGVGIYYTPSAFAQSGFIGGTFILIGAVVLSTLSIYALFEASSFMSNLYKNVQALPTGSDDNNDLEEGQKTDDMQEIPLNETEEGNSMLIKDSNFVLSYANIGYHVHYILGYAINTIIVFAGLSTCIFFQKFTAQITSSIFGYSENDNEWNLINVGFMVLYGVILLIVAQAKNLSKIEWLSYINLACMSLICLTTCILTFLLQGFVEQHPESTGKNGFLYTFVAFALAMTCQQNVVSIFSVLKDKSRKNLFLIAALGSIIPGALYFIIGNFGRILFGDNMNEIDIVSILINANSPIRQYIAQFHPALVPVIYVLCTLALIGLLIGLVFQQYAITKVFVNLSQDWKISASAQTFFWTLICVSAMTGFNIWVNMSLTEIFMLIGNFMVIPMSLIFPFIFMISLYPKKSYTRIIGSALIIILGIIVALWNTYDFYAKDSMIEQLANNFTTTKGLQTTPSA